MNAYAFKTNRVPALIFGFSLLLSVSVFILLQLFYKQASREVVESWYGNETVNLQQGNYLSSVTKLQRGIMQSHLLKGALAMDENNRILAEFGNTESIGTVPETEEGKISDFRTGIFKNVFVIKTGNIRILIFSGTNVLLAVFISLIFYFLSIAFVFGFSIRKLLIEQESLKSEIKMKDIRSQLEKTEAVSSVAKQVAHDIRSPLMALETVLAGAEIAEERRQLFMQANERIRKIANDLLHMANKSQMREPSSEINTKTFSLLLATRNIVLEKNFTLKDFKILLEFENDSKVRGESARYQRILSNLIDNSIESVAFGKNHEIKISIKNYGNNASVYIQDNGVGIPSEILSRIGEKGFSYGKRNGNGLGVSSAKETIKIWGGDMQIFSKEGEGTTIVLTLPIVAKKVDPSLPKFTPEA